MVLLIIALLAGSSIVAGVVQLNSSKATQTNDKLAAIEQAMMVYRKTNDRLPCPASPTLLDTNLAFGLEYPNPGTCTGARIYNTLAGAYPLIAEGVVPVRSLQLPDEFMYDGWGQRITYSVNRSMTMEKAFTMTAPYDDCGEIAIRGEGGTTRTQQSLYVLLSHGPNGHGGFNSQGFRVNTGSVNADELINCDCTSTSAYITPLSAQRRFVQRTPQDNPLDTRNSYDDIVRYKSRWQMSTENEKISKRAREHPRDKIELFVAFDTAQLTVFGRRCDRFWLANNTMNPQDIVPVNYPPRRSATFTKDGRYLAMAYNSGTINIFKNDGNDNSHDLLSTRPNTAGIAPNRIRFSPDGLYLANAHNHVAAPNRNLTIYKRNGDSFITLPALSMIGAANNAVDVAFSPDSAYVATALSGAPYVSIYKREGDNFGLMTSGAPMNAPDVTPAAAALSVSFSDNSNYLAVGYSAPPYVNVYKRNGDSFMLLGGALSANPPAAATALAFADDASYLAVATPHNDTVTMYKRSGDIFNAIPFTNTLGAGNPRSIAFAPHGRYLAVSDSSGNWYLKLYKRTGDTFIEISLISGSPLNNNPFNSVQDPSHDVGFVP